MMKNARILAATAAALTVGLVSACGTSTPVQPVAADSNCTEVAKPSDPHGLIGNEWPWMPSCDVLSDVTPGVDPQRAEAIVFDARQRVVAAKRNISVLAMVGNKESDPEALTEFHGRIENVRGRLADDLVDSTLALKGTPPEGFSLDYVRGGTIHSASPGLTGQGR